MSKENLKVTYQKWSVACFAKWSDQGQMAWSSSRFNWTVLLFENLTDSCKTSFFGFFFFLFFFFVANSSKEWFLQKHPEQIQNLFGKIFVFCFVWSFGGILKREDDSEDDGGISLAPRVGENEDGEGTNKKKGEVVDINISYEFDGFVHDMFDTEPPLGELSV